MSDLTTKEKLKNKEAKLAFDLAVTEIPSLENALFDAIVAKLDLRKLEKGLEKQLPKESDTQLVAAVLSKFNIVFSQILDLEEKLGQLAENPRKILKAAADLQRSRKDCVRMRENLRDSAEQIGFSLETVCPFLYQGEQ